MHLSELNFFYPEELIAVEPQNPCRILWDDGIEHKEVSKNQLLESIPAGDIVVVNDSQVLKRRVFVPNNEELIEVLFINSVGDKYWEVLMPVRKLKGQMEFHLPGGVLAKVVKKGLPQTIEVNEELTEDYFERYGDLPLPPYIQKQREQRKSINLDDSWYQNVWAEQPGSLAAPTAGLHFSKEDINKLKAKGVSVVNLTLHVGLGTFLPIKVDEIEDHEMHKELVSIDESVWEQILLVKKSGGNVWAIGTTVVRSLESCALGILKKENGHFKGETQLFIRPGFEFQVVDCLMTNFHQPGSTLLALVAGFSSMERVKNAYNWAIEQKFKLFSYGDLTVWK